MLMCHEMSHIRPSVMLADPRTAAWRNQGMASGLVSARLGAAARAGAAGAADMVASLLSWARVFAGGYGRAVARVLAIRRTDKAARRMVGRRAPAGGAGRAAGGHGARDIHAAEEHLGSFVPRRDALDAIGQLDRDAREAELATGALPDVMQGAPQVRIGHQPGDVIEKDGLAFLSLGLARAHALVRRDLSGHDRRQQKEEERDPLLRIRHIDLEARLDEEQVVHSERPDGCRDRRAAPETDRREQDRREVEDRDVADVEAGRSHARDHRAGEGDDRERPRVRNELPHRAGSVAEGKAVGEEGRQTARADAPLRLMDVVRRSSERDRGAIAIEQSVGRARIAIARLSDAAGVDQAAARERDRNV